MNNKKIEDFEYLMKQIVVILTSNPSMTVFELTKTFSESQKITRQDAKATFWFAVDSGKIGISTVGRKPFVVGE